MTRQEFKRCLKVLERSDAWFCRQAGTTSATLGYWFSDGGPGIPPVLADRLWRAAAQGEREVAEDPWPRPEAWRRDTRGGNPAIRTRRAAQRRRGGTS